ncbi:hypothetical protein [Arvimicrobium flavum]|uniref:hypothetical protein n=1 Tax=Arvimicrobium flavum TaxID=3393320 RepID=UPI00237B2C38|nr:hypothetical protein [Mesorhizobium shangrilense]
MKTVLAALCLMLVASEASAIERYNSSRMNCSRVQATINADGAAIMRYPSKFTPGLQLYGRYVRHGGFCTAGEYAERVFITASDTRSCPVRECKRIEVDDDFPFILRHD